MHCAVSLGSCPSDGVSRSCFLSSRPKQVFSSKFLPAVSRMR